MTVYLDNNATAQPTAVVNEAVARVLTTEYGNPSSPHSSGVATRSLIEGARHAIAESLGGLADNYVFTSGCTEANNTVLWSAYLSRRDALRIAVSSVEQLIGPGNVMVGVDHRVQPRGGEIISSTEGGQILTPAIPTSLRYGRRLRMR